MDKQLLKKENSDLRQSLQQCKTSYTHILSQNNALREWLTRCQAEKQEVERQRDQLLEVIRRLADTHRVHFTSDEIEMVEPML